MTKIKNTNAYPIKPIPKRSDYFIGTDSENNGKTVSFGFEEVLNLLGNSGVKVREVYGGFLGEYVDEASFEDSINTLLDNQSLVVNPNELVILAFDTLKTNPSSTNQNLVKYKYYFPLGQGTFNPLGDFVQYENLILTYEQPVQYNPDVIIDSPNAVVFPLGDIGEADYLDFINQSETPFNLTDESKIYYFRFTKDDVDYLYLFDEENSVNGYGFYGAGFFQFSLSELVLFYDSDNNNDPVESIPTKTSDLINDGADGTSTYVEANELGAVAFSNDYNDLDNLPTNTGSTNLGYTASPTNGTVTSDTGTNATIPLANGTNAGLLSPTEKTKISNISGTNTGDETTASIQTKRPLKTIEGQSLEGTGNIDLTKSDVGLANVDNTSDLSKPISTATQTALAAKLETVNTNDIVNHAVTNNKLAQMNANTYKGRSSGNGTPQDLSVADLPISTATQTALNAKQDKASATTSTQLTFTNQRVHGTFTAPITAGTITANLTGAIVGTRQKMYHQANVEPNYPLGFVQVGGAYVPSAKNIIVFEWSEGTRVEFFIY
jgi:hypothetical protein